MKSLIQVQEQIFKLEKIKIELEKQIVQVGKNSPIGINMSNQITQLDNDVKTLKWVINP